MQSRLHAVLLIAVATFLSSSASPAADFELQESDRVVFLGDGLIEQEQYFGWFEVMMTTAFPDRNVTFRNLGWNADTPAGDSRFGLSLLQAGREPAGEGWTQLQKQLELTQPTVLVLGYGMASALEGGTEGIEQFTDDYRRLLRAAEKISPGIRFVFLTPLKSLDDSGAINATIESYAGAIRLLADESGSPVVNLLESAPTTRLRKDPIHLNDAGYRSVATTIGNALGWDQRQHWQDSPQTVALRKRILRKGTWWFHRSRPANMAYVFGFRKHEQGQNAVEIPKFDALIQQEEAVIAALRDLKPSQINEPAPQIKSQYAKFTPQPTPEFTVGDGFSVNLWAENPLLNKPIQINFDPQGRLWVASSEAYPMIEVGQSAPDKILVLEDSNGDGKADKSTVFADGLLIPTGVEPGDGGVYVAQSTDLLFLKDTDGDGKADTRRRVLSGFGTEDTHHNLHTLRWGYDGRLYMNQSIYTRTDTETPHGVVRLKAGGGFRYNTQSMQMDVFFRGLVNSWGHQYDRFGQSFLSDGAGFQGLAYTFPRATFSHWPTARRVLDLISPGNYPKFASLEIIGGESFPPDWQESIVTCDFRANRVTRFSLQDQEAGFVTRQEADLLRTSASTFRPIDVKQGPDGALYIADWSNPIINHGEVDFRDERRDRWHGRIWRVTWNKAKPRPRVDLTALPNSQLLSNLLSNDRYTRDQSRRVLFERGDIAEDLASWAGKQQDNEFAMLQAAWLRQGVGVPSPKLHTAEDPRVRAAAVRILSDFIVRGRAAIAWPEASKILSRLIVDEHPRVRLETICALGRVGTLEAGLLALEAMNKPIDRFLQHALGDTIDLCDQPLMDAIVSGRWKADTPLREKQLQFVLTSIEPTKAGRFIAEHLRKNPISRNGSGPWIELVSKAGGREQLRAIYDQLASDHFDAAATARVLIALDDAARLRKLHLGKDVPALERFVAPGQAAEVRRAAAHLAGTWRLGRLVPSLKQIALEKEATDILRMTAIDSMRQIGGPGATALAAVALSDSKLPVRQRAVIALAPLNPAGASDLFFPLLQQLDSEDAALAAWRGMLSSRGVGKVLASKLAGVSLSQQNARAGARACKDGGRSEPELLATLTPLAGLEMKSPELTAERIAELVAQSLRKGHPGRGEGVYMRKELACVSCHAIGGVGGKVGPDMTSLGASAPLSYIIESLFKPNAKIKEGYHAVTVATEAGQVINGIEVESTDTELVLRSAEDKLIRIPQAEVLIKKPGQSLMPTGAIDRLSNQDQLDLIRFLSKLGKPGTFDASKGGVARVFEVFAGTHRIEQDGADRIISGRLSEGWKPLQARVSGNVFGSMLTALTRQPINISLVHVYLRTTVEASNNVQATITAAGPDSAALWIDGIRVDGERSFTTDIKKGKHTLVIRLDARELPNVFKLSSPDLSFATEL